MQQNISIPELVKKLTDLYFRPYTKKMWSFDLEGMPAAVVKRTPLHLNMSDTYFGTGEMQILPEGSYTKISESIFGHENIKFQLKTIFRKGHQRDFAHCFNAMP